MTTEEFKTEVLPLKNRLYRMAFRLLGKKEEAEDVVQETFIKLWNRRDTLGTYRSIEAFAVVITKNICLDRLKSKRNKVMQNDITVEMPVTATPYSQIDLQDSVSRVSLYISQLPDQQKIVMQLRDIEGYQHDEIAEMLQMNLNAVRVNLSRARKKVRDALIKAHSYEYSEN